MNQNVLDEFQAQVRKKYQNKIQELRLEFCEDQQHIKLLCIKIKKSQKEMGYGSAVMSDLITLADQHETRIVLWVTDIFGSDLKRLQGFYRKLGFVRIDGDNDGEMQYIPRKKKKV
jgi:ribosomal protein S18 acetylase RimI-like enzyme